MPPSTNRLSSRKHPSKFLRLHDFEICYKVRPRPFPTPPQENEK
jgi:hypothetical protein